MENVLEVKNLTAAFRIRKKEYEVLHDVSFSIKRNETLCVVGESGCGKSVTTLCIMQLLPSNGRIVSGSIKLDGVELTKLSKKEMVSQRGKKVGMIFQEPMTSLNPLLTIGFQMREMIMLHRGVKKDEADKIAIEYLRKAGIANPESRMKQYTFELSGGLRQRVMIAMMLSAQPSLLIADEPTTALDVTIQAQIIDLLKDLQKEKNASVILITHDLGVVANIADRIVVMYAGQIVERGSSVEVFHHPRHPYTNALLEAVPRLDLQNKQTLASIEGTPPDLIAPPKGCPFCTRCKYCMEICCEQQPPVLHFGDGHEASCWLYKLETPAADAPFTQEAHYEG